MDMLVLHPREMKGRVGRVNFLFDGIRATRFSAISRLMRCRPPVVADASSVGGNPQRKLLRGRKFKMDLLRNR